MRIQNVKANRRAIPKHARRVFRGVVFDIYQWKQRMFDGTTGVFEKAKRANSVTIVPVREDGKILMTREHQPGKHSFIGVPGGIIDGNESPMAAARRELLEETGYSAKRLIPWFSYPVGSRIDWTVHLFIARGCRKVRSPHLDAGERIKVRPVTFKEFIRIVTTSSEMRNQEIVLRALRARLDARKMRALRRDILGTVVS